MSLLSGLKPSQRSCTLKAKPLVCAMQSFCKKRTNLAVAKLRGQKDTLMTAYAFIKLVFKVEIL
ncbi:hypothetical protein [uncultured Helicobacter sp.]|uniref:hypothetical protein n=1 Tax=uncultured Helicobacter sp. TaxID=175537 RepID=UPI00262BFE44|nr:hypothetical protein [uncultured Helicobacter sp.]